MAGFIAGFDHDDQESIVDMADRLMEIGIDVPFLSIMTPFKGTPIYEQLKSENRIMEERGWSYYNGYNVAFIPKRINENELLYAHRVLWKRAFSIKYAAKRIFRSALSLRWGAFCLSLFMNSFYCLKRIRKNFPIDITKRPELNNRVLPPTKYKKHKAGGSSNLVTVPIGE